MNKLVFASVISSIEQSDIFMTVKARICEAPAANLNGARVTEAFIDEVVNNHERYVGLPLYADVKALTSGNYRRLGHLYDSRTGEFHSTQIGSFYQFEKEEFETTTIDGTKKGCYLVGYARIAKRNNKLSKAIHELFADGALKFSFEVAVGEYEELDDDTILIDASDRNYLEGTAIVTFPACEDAVALELVAQRKADDTEGGEKEMADIKTKEVAEQPEVVEPEKEPEKVEETVETPEETVEQPAEEITEAPVETPAETIAEQQDETAAVVVRESTHEEHTTCAFDTETGTDVCQTVSVDTSVSRVEPDAQIVEADDGVHIAEEDGAETPAKDESGESGDEDPAKAESDTPEPAAEDPILPGEDSKKKTAEQMIAELVDVINELKSEVAELKEKRIVAETKPVTAEVNLLVDSINSNGTYSLLQKEEKNINSYSLLEQF